MKLSEKNWTKELEKPIYLAWKEKANPFKPEGKLFSIDTPPPYVNTPVHMGHATTYTLMDMFARFHRMIGDNVLFPLGLDRNGLPIESAAEKKYKVKLTEIPREKAIEYCGKVLEEASITSVETFLRLGHSYTSWKIGTEIGEIYQTDSDDYRALTQATFIDLYEKGLIYEDERVNNYCPGCQTTIADSEIDYKEIPTLFTDIKFKIKETGKEIIIGTTRPEFLATCERILYNPEDKRYKELEGKHAIIPIYGREALIIAHPLAQIDKGTGLVMMCAFGDYSDIRFFREHKIKPRIAVDIKGTLNQNAGFLEGLKITEGRKKILEELKKQNLIVKQVQITHQTPICERSEDPIEFIALPEYYVKQTEFKKTMKEFAEKINFYSTESRQILIDWINAVSTDWPITRRRFYATEVPLWYCKKCKTPHTGKRGQYVKPWRQSYNGKCKKCENTNFEGDTRVFDTWFDSSISPLYLIKWDKNPKIFDKLKPMTLRPQGKEIVRTWLYYTLLKCYHLTGECIFRDVWIHHHIVDEQGHKMSKRKGNIIDPVSIIDKFGAEPFRLWSAVEGNLSNQDFRCSFERIEGAGKTITKLWNISKFISNFPETQKPKKLCALDEWITNELNKILNLANECYTKYDFHNPTVSIKHFIWETLASHYIELVKNRAYNQDKTYTEEEEKSAHYTLNQVLQTLCKILAPVLPMLTFRIYNDIYGKDIHAEKFPKTAKETKTELTTEKIIELNSIIWKTKKDKGISLKSEITKATIPESFMIIEKDLKKTHGIKELNYGGEIKITI